MEKAVMTKYIVAALLAVVVVGGGATYYLSGKHVTSDAAAPLSETAKSTESATATPAAAATETASVAAKGKSLKELIASAMTAKCTVTTSSEQSDSSGMVYVTGGKLRSDFTNTMKTGPAAGKVQVAHMIVDTEYSYMWGDGMMKIGIKMATKDMLDVKPENGNTPQNQAAVDMNEKSDYKCSSWKANSSYFTPPSDIEFQDMGAMMKNMPGMDAGATLPAGGKMETGAVAVPTGMTKEQMSQMCGQCDAAGAGRDQCRTALGCM